MSKRLVRIFQRELYKKAESLLTKEISVILESNHTYFGRCTHIEHDILFLQDYRFKKHALPFTQIAEVIYDHEAEY